MVNKGKLDDCRGGKELSEGDLTRVAMRIAMSAFSQLQTDSETTDDAQLLKKYLSMCPYVSPDSPALAAAMHALDSVALSTVPSQVSGIPDTNMSGEYIKTRSPAVISPEKEKKGPAEAGKSVIVKKPKPQKKKMDPRWGIVGRVVRMLLVDSPLAIVFGLYLAVLWTRHVHDNYLKQQVDAMYWNDERAYREVTYYNRICDRRDMSTTTPSDLFLSMDATPDEAYQHHLKHGMTVFPQIISDETATEIRDFIVSRNRNLTVEESIFVIENTNRYSFGLGTEEPSVAKAMSEIATNKRLSAAIEKIVGPSPALIEMTAITSSYGAIDQYWHDDVIAAGSAIKFARTFGPSYSLFMQLQNTTTTMGATGVCPGTQMCADGAMDKFCEDHGFQLVNADGYWRAGDAMLMNMNTWHRGAAHTDPTALDRVMLILTFVPQPRAKAESRQMSQGITFSLRWDMWGHTLMDLANSHTVMTQPWATLRALGLFKLWRTDWGLDYVTSSSMRISNEDNGFRRDELEEFVERGGIKWLPKFLHTTLEDSDSYYDYYLKTLLNLEAFFSTLNAQLIGGYVLIQLFLLLVGLTVYVRSKKADSKPFRAFRGAAVRLALTHGLLYLAYSAAIHHVDNTDWAKGHKAGLLYSPVFSAREEDTYQGPTTIPHRKDILIETRYGSNYLYMYNDFISNHPGNRVWVEWLEEYSQHYPGYAGLPRIFRDRLAEQIVGAMENEAARFLYQGPFSHWKWMSREDSIKQTKIELVSRSDYVLQEMLLQLRFLVSEGKYGLLREATMTVVDILPYLQVLKSRMLKAHGLDFDEKSAGTEYWPRVGKDSGSSSQWMRVEPLRKPSCPSRFERRKAVLNAGVLPKEPKRGAWMKEGDIVECRFREDNGRDYWYLATILLATSSGDYHIEFHDGGREAVSVWELRWYRPLRVGDLVEYDNDGRYVRAEVIRDHGDDSYDLYVKRGGYEVLEAYKGYFRRAF